MSRNILILPLNFKSKILNSKSKLKDTSRCFRLRPKLLPGSDFKVGRVLHVPTISGRQPSESENSCRGPSEDYAAVIRFLSFHSLSENTGVERNSCILSSRTCSIGSMLSQYWKLMLPIVDQY